MVIARQIQLREGEGATAAQRPSRTTPAALQRLKPERDVVNPQVPAAGEGVVVRNDNQPGRVGFKVVKALEAGSQPDKWSGQVFAARLGEYRDATITLESDDRLAFTVKVGMMRRTVEWRRVPEVPSATDDE